MKIQIYGGHASLNVIFDSSYSGAARLKALNQITEAMKKAFRTQDIDPLPPPTNEHGWSWNFPNYNQGKIIADKLGLNRTEEEVTTTVDYVVKMILSS